MHCHFGFASATIVKLSLCSIANGYFYNMWGTPESISPFSLLSSPPLTETQVWSLTSMLSMTRMSCQTVEITRPVLSLEDLPLLLSPALVASQTAGPATPTLTLTPTSIWEGVETILWLGPLPRMCVWTRGRICVWTRERTECQGVKTPLP